MFSLIATVLEILYKIFGNKPKDVGQEVEKVNAKMLKDAVNKPSDSDVIDKLQRGEF